MLQEIFHGSSMMARFRGFEFERRQGGAHGRVSSSR